MTLGFFARILSVNTPFGLKLSSYRTDLAQKLVQACVERGRSNDHEQKASGRDIPYRAYVRSVVNGIA